MSVTWEKQRASISLSLDWDNIFKKGTTEQRRELLKAVTLNRDTIKFCTGSSYTGKWNALGMDVHGSYIFPHRCEYEGGFEDGRFHGRGTLSYPMGQKLEGLWHKGKMVSYNFSNVDGLGHNPDWNYCKMPDRRFVVSIRDGLQPAGREFLTNQQPTRPIDSYSYDTGDGFFDPVTRSIITARDPVDFADLEQKESTEVVETFEENDLWVNALTMVSDERERWITSHCRKGWDQTAGYRPDLYSDWITGRKKEIEQLDVKYKQGPPPIDTELTETEVTGGSITESDEVQPSIQYAGTGRKLLPSSRSLLSSSSYG